MADQYTPAPAPSKTEFNTLNTQVQGLAEQIGTLTTTYNSHNHLSIGSHGQNNTARTITFSGNARRRMFYGILCVAGQQGITEPIAFGFTGNGSEYGVIGGVMISPNQFGITASGFSISIPASIGSGWGRIDIVRFYDDPELTITIT